MSERMIKYIPSQQDTGQYIGAIKELFGRTSFYITVINFFLLIVTAYYTTIRDFIPISFLTFIATTVLMVCVAMVIEYVVILPSSVVFQNIQAYKHTNPLKDDVKLILERLDKIDEKISK
ncbi:hypothetical protein GQ473_05060 [archaeon]|nr:hypothetical protein [archaeon]